MYLMTLDADFDAAFDATTDTSAEPVVQTVSLGLGGLSAGIAAMGDVTVTVDGVPDAARLSAGQFLGDGRWHVRVADLDGLAIFPSPGRHRNCQISIRLRKIDKDMDESFSIGAVYVDVDADSGRSAIAGTEGAISLRRKDADREAPPPETLAPEPAEREMAPPEKSESKPLQKIVRVTRAKPVRSAPFSDEDFPTPIAPFPDQGLSHQETPAWPTEALPVEIPIQATSMPDPSEPGVAPPPVLNEEPSSPFVSAPLAAPGPAPVNRLAPKRASSVQAGAATIVAVHVAHGLRIGKFGKIGRPEDVVSVRGRDINAKRANSDPSRSIVVVRQRSYETHSA